MNQTILLIMALVLFFLSSLGVKPMEPTNLLRESGYQP